VSLWLPERCGCERRAVRNGQRFRDERNDFATGATLSRRTQRGLLLFRGRCAFVASFAYCFSGFDEAVATLPVFFQLGSDEVAFGFGDVGKSIVCKVLCFGFGEFEHAAVADEARDAEVGQAGLFGAEELAGAALLEVEFGEFEAVLGTHHGVEAEFGFGAYLVAGHEDAVAFGGAAADATAELVHLGHAEALGVFDDHDAGVGDVDADLDDGSGDEDVDLAALKLAHRDLLVVGGEASMEEADAEVVEGTVAEVFEHFGGGA